MAKLSDLVKKGFPLGEQVVEISEVERTTSKSGNPQLMFHGTNSDGVNGVWWRPLIPEGLGFLAADFLAIGKDLDPLPEDQSEWPDYIANAAETTFTGAVVNIEVKPSKNNPDRTEVVILSLA